MIEPYSIGVYYVSPEGKHIFLPDTSEHLNRKQLIPACGDGITIYGKDNEVMGIHETDFKHILTVKRRWFHYNHNDVALLCHYESW